MVTMKINSPVKILLIVYLLLQTSFIFGQTNEDILKSVITAAFPNDKVSIRERLYFFDVRVDTLLGITEAKVIGEAAIQSLPPILDQVVVKIYGRNIGNDVYDFVSISKSGDEIIVSSNRKIPDNQVDNNVNCQTYSTAVGFSVSCVSQNRS
jgi:hypothetical protein